MADIAVMISHDEPDVVRALAETIDACSDMFVAGAAAGEHGGAVLIAGGAPLRQMTRPSMPLIAVASGGDEISAARAALAAGAREIVRWPAEAYRLSSLIRLAAEIRDEVGSEVVAFLGARGGAGTSTAALVTAIGAGRSILVDLFGEGCALEGAPGAAAAGPDGSLRPVFGLTRRMDARPVFGEPSEAIRAARAASPAVVVDAGRDLGAASGADRIVVVMSDDIPSARGLASFLAAGCAPSALVVRRERRDGVPVRDLTASVDVPVVVVPRDRALARALDLGQWPARPTKAMRALARLDLFGAVPGPGERGGA